ncbi:hypothetical protein [Candidatus Binatus sp.]|uniref:hypothetical protein n=1 Tax=Candidatus Binatus sp. TaxID=2811406 RepID=UPI003C89B765
MKHPKTLLAGAIILLATAITSVAMAQEMGPKMDKFLNAHPDLAAKVRADPSLLYNKQFRDEHPELQTFMQNHPNEYKRLAQHGVGAYDSGHVWRDENWWHAHDPNWVNEHHPEWAHDHPEWAQNHAEVAPHPGTYAEHEPVAGANEAGAIPAQKHHHHN